jgi:DNA polymerase-3 subunit gamma/tau
MPEETPSKDQNTATATATYRVLARKYRPNTVDELIGQESLVQTLSNALEMGRLAHAFILTGLRGIGKTTTARIIAKGLNCIGADGNGKPTLKPCGACTHCKDISEGRHVDVLEMDAASNTGVDDVREIIEGVHYAPLSARFKVYIIDEVHMLSKSAFNALLKTLEEPPEAVKFVFATTEIRKVPVTVLSRCQRFDLRRVPTEMMAKHLKSIAEKETITIDEAALLRLARAAEGSVRDALSLLDQAAALTSDTIRDDAVAAMLGQAGRMDAIQIMSAALTGDTKAAIDGLAGAVRSGAEPVMVIADMLDFIHLASRQAAGGTLTDLPDAESDALVKIGQEVAISRLARAWQLMLKGHAEVNLAPNPHAAADMVLIRLSHMANMPTPADLVRKLKDVPTGDFTATPSPQPETPDAPHQPDTAEGQITTEIRDEVKISDGFVEPPIMPQPMEDEAPSPAQDSMMTEIVDDGASRATESHVPASLPIPETIRDMVSLFEDQGELIIAGLLTTRIKPVLLKPGRFEFSADPQLDDTIPGKIGNCLSEWTGIRWTVSVTSAVGGETLDELDDKANAALKEKLLADPMLKEAMAAFPGSDIHSIIPLTGMISVDEDHSDEDAPHDQSAPQDKAADHA